MMPIASIPLIYGPEDPRPKNEAREILILIIYSKSIISVLVRKPIYIKIIFINPYFSLLPPLLYPANNCLNLALAAWL